MLEKIKEFIAREDIISLYELVDHEALDLEMKQELQEIVLQLATEKMHDKMAEGSAFDFEDKSEQFVLRVLYENAIGAFQAGERYDSCEAFSMLSASSSSKLFEKALKKHLLALQEGVDFDTFINEWVSVEPPKHFFISSFTKEVEKMFVAQEKALSIATQSYAKFFR